MPSQCEAHASRIGGIMTIHDPLAIAVAHQKHMHELVAKIRADAGCIRQLLVGRKVRRKADGIEFLVKEARLGLSSHVSLYGRRTGSRSKEGGARFTRIGLIDEIELVEVKP
jgi:hypothetical protein